MEFVSNIKVSPAQADDLGHLNHVRYLPALKQSDYLVYQVVGTHPVLGVCVGDFAVQVLDPCHAADHARFFSERHNQLWVPKIGVC